MAPAGLVAAIIMFIQALFCESSDRNIYAHYFLVRHGVLVANCTLWYFLRKRCTEFGVYMLPFQYACYTGTILYFCVSKDLEKNLGPNYTLLSILESNVNQMSFMTVSLFFARSFTIYLYVYLPTFTVFQCVIDYWIVSKMSEVEIIFMTLIFTHTLLICLLTTVLVYRQFLTQISFDLLKFEGSSQIDQLQMVLNKQTDGIALIEQTEVTIQSQT